MGLMDMILLQGKDKGCYEEKIIVTSLISFNDDWLFKKGFDGGY